MAYILPQVQVFQLFAQVPTTVIQNLNAFVFGPNYQLFRYSEAAEKALIGIGAYDADSDVAYDYPQQPVGSDVDLDYVKLFLEDVWAEYAIIASSASNPLVVVSESERNKLRAAPVISTPENVDTTHPSLGSGTKGYFIGEVALPEYYYFYPTGGDTGTMWEADGYQSDISNGSGEDAVLQYITSEDLTGTVEVNNTDNPLTNGVTLPGPDGLRIEFDSGSSDNLLTEPWTIKFQDVATTSYFVLSVDPAQIKAMIDWDVDDGNPVKINVDISGSDTVSWTPATRTLAVTGATYTLTALKAALENDSDIAAYFDIGEITGTGANVVTDAVTQAAASVDGAGDTELITSAYRIRVTANPYIFSTGNDYNHTTQFLTRGVQVGDRVRYQVTDPSAVTYEGTTKVVGFEADESLATVADPEAKETNAVSTTETQFVPKTGVDIVEAGADNQRDFDGVDTKVYALDADNAVYPGELSAGVLEDTFTATITAAGAAGVAQATVESVSGTYVRTNVPVEEDPTGDATRARIYVGRNLWVMLDQGTGDADAEFQVGDVYTFSADVESDYTPPTAAQVAVSGTYTGLGDTTYVVEVIRGGVFDRTVNTIDGLINPSQMEITYTGQPSGGDKVTVGSVEFEAGSEFAIGGDADTTYANLVTAVNAYPFAVYAVQDTTAGTVTLTGPGSLINGSFLGTDITDFADYTLATEITDAVQLNAVVNMDDWTGGDIDDEYVLKCTSAGSITSAQFQLTSQQGDDASGIQFPGWGATDTDAISVGGRGLGLYFTDLNSTAPSFGIGDYFIVKLNMSRPQVRITDTAGIDNGSTIVVDNATAISVGSFGIDLEFAANGNTEGGFVANGGLVLGDVYYIEAVASADGALRTLVLADELPISVDEGIAADGSTNDNPSNFAVWLYLVKNGVEIEDKRVQSPPDYNWEATADDVTVNSGMQVQDATWVNLSGDMPYMDVYAADMYLEYRALLSTYSDTINGLDDIADVITTLGTVDPDNPLAQGVYNALSNSGNRGVYYMAVPSNDLAGYSAVLDRATLSDDVYGLVPMTRDLQIINTVEAHINAMSTETEKRWRIGFVGTEMPTELGIYKLSTNPASEEYYATVEDNPSVSGTQYTKLNFTDAAGDPSAYTQALDDLVPGDKIRISYSTDAWGGETYSEYTVDEVVSNTSVILVSGPAAPIPVPTKVEAWHDYSVAEMAEAVAALSTGFANRRMYHVFPSELGAFGVIQTSEFGAAAVAGLMSSVPPQQGITNIELNGFDDLPMVYSTFNRQQLNDMAEAGTLIVMQDTAGGRIYIRHQVSTQAQEGNLNTTELSVTKNLDSISYYFANRLAAYIGRYNITPELLEVLRTQVSDGLNYLGGYTGAGLLGPQIILEGTRIVNLQQHPTLRDHVVATVALNLPYPLNVIELSLVV